MVVGWQMISLQSGVRKAAAGEIRSEIALGDMQQIGRYAATLHDNPAVAAAAQKVGVPAVRGWQEGGRQATAAEELWERWAHAG